MNLTAEQSKALVRIFEEYVRDSEHANFKNVGFLDWTKGYVFPTPSNRIAANVPFRNRDVMMFIIGRDGAVIT